MSSLEGLLSRMTVQDVMDACRNADPNAPFTSVFSGGSPSESPKARKASGPMDPLGGFVTKAPYFEVSHGGLSLKKVGNDGKWNTARLKPGVGIGSRKYWEFTLKKLKRAVNQQIVLGLTLENMPKDNFLGTSAFSWGYGSKYGHVYHKGADIDFAEQCKQGDVIGILMSGPAMYVYKNGKKLGKAGFADLQGSGEIYGAVSLLNDGDHVVVRHAEPPA